ncbi:MarR family transcriptional regulator [Rhodopseudomonas sp. AAP120]|uniref:MarR family winged helix-turn-helix transcriptional regulator n=1 Tax=Rhodopseudomonas TaxID=1073 RepID=UPI0001779702|nr:MULTISPECIES: MarR family transcriptional regulator [Rhodopseudomonas]ACF00814.1 transcriptional regulator, MarR family [Rhodopseudomonas palustris TIE-1]KPG01758.1 MarR family transcriptional regulator [Rhodopseudomonas sp. AAP120]
MRHGAPEFDPMDVGFPNCGDKTKRSDKHLMWNLMAVSSSLVRVAELLGRRLGITGSQWLLLEAIRFLSRGDGVPVGEAAALLDVKGSFISFQARSLEERGFLCRKQSGRDKRVFLLSLTENAEAKLGSLEAVLFSIEPLLRGGLDDDAIRETANRLDGMRRRLARARGRAKEN